MNWADGSSFVGLWKNDMRDEGEMKFLNGMIYRGKFQNDRLDGPGMLLVNSGVIFKGNFTQNLCSSVGLLLQPSGDIYFG
jgi:hypothetical protein